MATIKTTIYKEKYKFKMRVSYGTTPDGRQRRKFRTCSYDQSLSKREIDSVVKQAEGKFLEEVESLQKVLDKYSYTFSPDISFKEYAEYWFDCERKEGRLKASTLRRFEQCSVRVYKALGHLGISEITYHHIQNFIHNLGEDGTNAVTHGKLSTKSQKLHLNMISDVMRLAKLEGLRDDNPCREIRTVKTESKERAIYTIEEAQQFLNLLAKEPYKYQAFFLLAIFCGFRRGEILGLRWSDIDFENGIISINRTAQYESNGLGHYTTAPKTKSSQRMLKLQDSIIDLLKRLHDEQKESIFSVEITDDTDWIFKGKDGGMIGIETIPNWYRRFCTRNGIRHISIHGFRHLNATLMISKGIDVKTVSAMLGHSQVSTTLNIYAHSFAETMAKASEAVSSVLMYEGVSEKKD